jgi:transposase
MLERGIAYGLGLRFLRAELAGILATRTDALSPRMLHILETCRQTSPPDARIEDLASEIKAFSSRPKLRTIAVPGHRFQAGPGARIWDKACNLTQR